jgi:hypothetical protein
MKDIPKVKITYRRKNGRYYATDYENELLLMFGEFLLPRKAMVLDGRIMGVIDANLITVNGRKKIKIEPVYC